MPGPRQIEKELQLSSWLLVPGVGQVEKRHGAETCNYVQVAGCCVAKYLSRKKRCGNETGYCEDIWGRFFPKKKFKMIFNQAPSSTLGVYMYI